jgi:hypothetical protein
MTKLGIATLALVLGSCAAVAQGRLQTPAMTCGQVHNVVARTGGIVLGTGGYTYDRYVADARFCLNGQATRRQIVPTIDTPYCPLLICYDPTGNWWNND